MGKFVYVVTREDSCKSVVLGIYTEALSAANAVWSLACGSIIKSIKEQLVGTLYTVLTPENKEEYYYIEKVTLNEKLW